MEKKVLWLGNNHKYHRRVQGVRNYSQVEYPYRNNVKIVPRSA